MTTVGKNKVSFTIFLLFCLLGLLFVSSTFAKGKKVHWSPKKVKITAGSNETVSLVVSFESGRSLSDISLWVVSKLQSFISVSPTHFTAINANTSCSVSMKISIPEEIKIGTDFDGTIHLQEHKGKHKGKSDDDSGGDEKRSDDRHGYKTILENLKIDLVIIDSATFC